MCTVSNHFEPYMYPIHRIINYWKHAIPIKNKEINILNALLSTFRHFQDNDLLYCKKACSASFSNLWVKEVNLFMGRSCGVGWSFGVWRSVEDVTLEWGWFGKYEIILIILYLIDLLKDWSRRSLHNIFASKQVFCYNVWTFTCNFRGTVIYFVQHVSNNSGTPEC